MSIDGERLREETLHHVAGLCAAAAITAPKSGGQLFIRGKHSFIETVWLADQEPQFQLAAWMRARGRERREAIWFRDAALCERVGGILFIGLKNWYPPIYDCGACGYATCAEFLSATTELRKTSAKNLEFVGPTCNLRDIDLGIAVGSAAKTASLNNVDCRCQTRVATAARHTGLISADIAVALSLSITDKAEGFDRGIPEIDFDSEAEAGPPVPNTGLQPQAVTSGSRPGGRSRQARR